jgi:SAM-dependent methyltransferase
VVGTSEPAHPPPPPPFGGPHLDRAPEVARGYVDALAASGRPPPRGAAARVNGWRLTARAYEPLWRLRSLGLLTWGAFSTARELAALRLWLAPLAGTDALDVGCSAGLYARTLAAEGARVHALDASAAFLVEAGARAAAAGVAPTLVRGDAHALPYQGGSFDRVAVGATLNELSDPAGAVAEIARVLRPGGRAWFMYVRRAAPAGRPLQALLRLGGLRFPEPTDLDAWATAVGLQPIRSERRGPVVLALYGRGGGAPTLSTTSPSPGWGSLPSLRRTRRNTAPPRRRGR